MSGSPQTRHKISPCMSHMSMRARTPYSPPPLLNIGEWVWKKGSGERKKNRERIGPVRRPVQNHPLTLAARLNKCIRAKKSQRPDHYRWNWESIGHERMGSSALLPWQTILHVRSCIELCAHTYSLSSHPYYLHGNSIVASGVLKKKCGEISYTRFDKLRANTARQSVVQLHHWSSGNNVPSLYQVRYYKEIVEKRRRTRGWNNICDYFHRGVALRIYAITRNFRCTRTMTSFISLIASTMRRFLIKKGSLLLLIATILYWNDEYCFLIVSFFTNHTSLSFNYSRNIPGYRSDSVNCIISYLVIYYCNYYIDDY